MKTHVFAIINGSKKTININCFEKKEDNCSQDYPYLINITKEFANEPSNWPKQNYPKIFNDVCYPSCSFLTKENKNNMCECDNNKGY